MHDKFTHVSRLKQRSHYLYLNNEKMLRLFIDNVVHRLENSEPEPEPRLEKLKA
jgi:hypothetical protein